MLSYSHQPHHVVFFLFVTCHTAWFVSAPVAQAGYRERGKKPQHACLYTYSSVYK